MFLQVESGQFIKSFEKINFVNSNQRRRLEEGVVTCHANFKWGLVNQARNPHLLGTYLDLLKI